MTFPTLAARWLNGLVYLLVAALAFVPVLVLPPRLLESFKVGTEFEIVILAWVTAGVIGVARALEGRALLPLELPTARWLMGLMVWVIIGAALVTKPAMHLAYGATVFACLLAGLTLVAWLDGAARRRMYVFSVVAALVGFECLIATMQYAQFPFRDLIKGTEITYLHNWFAIVAAGSRGVDGLGTMGNRNYLGELLVLSTPILFAAAFASRRLVGRIAFSIVGLAAVGVLVASSARASLAGLFLGAGLAGLIVFGPQLLSPKFWWEDQRRRAALVVVPVIFAVMLAFAGTRLSEEATVKLTEDNSAVARLVNWKAAAGLWLEHPIQGIGLGAWKVNGLRKLAEQNPTGLPAMASEQRFYQLHNEWLQGLAELGVVGFVLIVGACFAWLGAVRQNPTLATPLRWGLLASFFGLAAASVFGFPFHIGLTAVVFLFLMACGLARPPLSPGATDASPPEEAAPEARQEASLLPVGARVPLALVTLVVMGGVAWLAISRGVWPLWQASHYAYLATEVAKDKRADGGDVLFGLAVRHDRFKAMSALRQLQILSNKKRLEESLAVYDANLAEGLGMDATLTRAGVLRRMGRREEAIATYRQVMSYYHPSYRGYGIAARRLQAMGVPAATPATSAAPPASAASPAAAATGEEGADDEAASPASPASPDEPGDDEATHD